MQHLRVLRVAKKLKREALAKEEEEEEYLPKELVARVDVSEEEPEKEKDSDLDNEDSEDEGDCGITDSEEPEALDSASTASINRYFHHCARLIEAYGAGEVYGTKEFAERVYKSHRRVVDKSKW